MIHLLVIMVMGLHVLGAPQGYGSTLTEKKDPSSPYGFSYNIQEGHSGVNLGHSEERNGRTVHGQYSVLLPDGRTQTVTYQADPLNGFQPTIGYENKGDRHSQRSTNDNIKNQDLNFFENIKRSFPESQEIIIDQTLYPRNDGNVGKQRKHGKRLESNSDVDYLQSHVDYDNERIQNQGIQKNTAKNSPKSQKEKSNINDYFGSNITFSYLNEDSQNLWNIDTNNSVETLKINGFTKEQEHKQTFEEFHVDDVLPEHFIEASKEKKIYADSQYFEQDFEVIPLNDGGNKKNSDLAYPNFDTEESEMLQYFDSSHSPNTNRKRKNIPTTNDNANKRKRVQLSNSNRRRKKIPFTSENVNERKRVQLTNTNRRRKNNTLSTIADHTISNNKLDIAMIIGDGFGSRLSSLSTNVPPQTDYQDFSSYHENLKTNEGNYANVYNENNGEKMHNVPLPISSGTMQLDNQDTEAYIHEEEMYLDDDYKDDKTLELPHNTAQIHLDYDYKDEKTSDLPYDNPQSYLSNDYEYEYLVNESYENFNLPKNNATVYIDQNLHYENESSSNLYIQNNSNSISKDLIESVNEYVDETLENDNMDTETNKLDDDIYLDNEYEDNKTLELPHNTVLSHITNEYDYLVNESHEKSNFPINNTSGYKEENPQHQNESSYNIYTQHNTNSISKDLIDSENAYADEAIENKNYVPPIYDNDVPYDYEYEYYDEYENYDTVSNQTENHYEERKEILTNSTEKIQASNVHLPIIDLEIPDKESFSENSTKGNNVATPEEALGINSLPDDNIIEKDYYNEEESFVSSPTLVKDIIMDQTSYKNENNSNNHSQNDTNNFKDSPITIKVDLIEEGSDYIYDETTEIIEAGYITMIERDFNSSEYEKENIHEYSSEVSSTENPNQDNINFTEINHRISILSENNIDGSLNRELENTHEHSSEIPSTENPHQDNKNYTEVNHRENILSENNIDDSLIVNPNLDNKNSTEVNHREGILSDNNIDDYISSDSIEYITYPTEIFSETVEELDPSFQTDQPDIDNFQNHQEDEVGINTYALATTDKDSRMNESIYEMPSDKRKFTRPNKENESKQLPERFRQNSTPSVISVIRGHENHPHRPKKNLVTKQS